MLMGKSDEVLDMASTAFMIAMNCVSLVKSIIQLDVLILLPSFCDEPELERGYLC